MLWFVCVGIWSVCVYDSGYLLLCMNVSMTVCTLLCWCMYVFWGGGWVVGWVVWWCVCWCVCLWCRVRECVCVCTLSEHLNCLTVNVNSCVHCYSPCFSAARRA